MYDLDDGRDTMAADQLVDSPRLHRSIRFEKVVYGELASFQLLTIEIMSSVFFVSEECRGQNIRTGFREIQAQTTGGVSIAMLCKTNRPAGDHHPPRIGAPHDDAEDCGRGAIAIEYARGPDSHCCLDDVGGFRV